MSRKYVYLVICCVMLSAHSYRLINNECEGSLCLYLYETESFYVNWDTSRTACKDEGLEMLRIESSQTQTVVNRLNQDLLSKRVRNVWTGGRGSSDDIWRYTNGTVFYQIVWDNGDSSPCCVHVKLCKNATPEYVANNCDDKQSTAQVLCQYDKSETGECRQSDYQFGNKCYAKTPYDDSESKRIDWYGGQTYCSQSPIQGDIAYSYLDDKSSINSVRSLFDDGDGCAILWLGVRRRIWLWRTVSDSDGQPINYFNWLNGTQIQPSYGSCIYVDSGKENKWRTLSCYYNTPFFVCMNLTTSTTTTTAAAATFTSDVIATTTKHLDNNHTTLTVDNNSQLLNNYKIASLTTLLISVVLLAVIIILTVTFIRYRRKMSRQGSSNSHTGDVTRTLATGSLPLSDLSKQDDGQVEYEQITGQDGQGHPVETEVNPYEKPTTYINMVDRPNTYEAVKK